MLSRPLVALVACVVALLAGCTVSAGPDTPPTVPAEEIERTAAEALEGETGVLPTIDCGDAEISVEVDASVTCLLVDPVAGLEFDTVITFTDVTDSAYSIDVQVAEVPNNAPVPTAEPGASVSITEIEALAIRALTTHLDFVPEVSCDGAEVEIVVGNTVPCSYPTPSGVVDAVVTITAFDATTSRYSIRVD